MTTLKTERLILRPHDLSDAERISLFTSDPAVARMTCSIPYPNPAIAAEGRILLQQARSPWSGEIGFAVDLPGEGLIGSVGGAWSQGRFEIGYWIGRPWWRRGFATEAVQALLKHLEATGVKAVHASVFLDNTAAAHILGKLGFVREGEPRRTFSLARGGEAPSWALLRSAEARAAA